MTETKHMTPIEYANKIKYGIKAKSDETKRFSTFLFLVILISTVFSPALILISNEPWLSKYLPAFLTACAALASYWIQLRKPQERWLIYRTAQREIEYEIDQYTFGNGDYVESNNKDLLLTDRVSKRALQLHYEWMPIVPKIDDVNKIL
jgi:hypothetical protein